MVYPLIFFTTIIGNFIQFFFFFFNMEYISILLQFGNLFNHPSKAVIILNLLIQYMIEFRYYYQINFHIEKKMKNTTIMLILNVEIPSKISKYVLNILISANFSFFLYLHCFCDTMGLGMIKYTKKKRYSCTYQNYRTIKYTIKQSHLERY